ncbi:hypothetical protein ACXN5S_17285 [Pseudoroseicyclus sp. H15]
MPDFWSVVGASEKSEKDIVLAAAWYLERTSDQKPKFSEVVSAVERNGVRLNINRSRLRGYLRRAPGVSISNSEEVLLKSEMSQVFADRYGGVSDFPTDRVVDTVLDSAQFESDRRYIKSVVRQINGSRQQEFFDACAVLMRRLMEISIIDAFERLDEHDAVRNSNGEIFSLDKLISLAKECKLIQLSRGSKPALSKIKTLGDRAAHNRSYITTAQDVDELKQDFRTVISDLRA